MLSQMNQDVICLKIRSGSGAELEWALKTVTVY